MSQPVIEVKGLSKVYQIGHERQGMKGTATLRDSLSELAHKPAELITGRRLKREEFWALKDINFEVNQGDVVGIIGKNGSGKSTLLKILSRIVDPTEGEAHMRGKVASLLEVGTGFHPELTGRENIFFNGAILGMKRKEIISKFDEIVAFSEVEQFLDTPVKFYSSGMYVRLAFAVAAHLDPDILIVDEVLAVGDAAFQKKSLGKMKSVAASGRTVLFVSHSMDSISRLCNKGILLSRGQIKYSGSSDAAIRMYSSLQKSSSPILDLSEYKSLGSSSLKRLSIQNSKGENELVLKALEEFSISLKFQIAAEDNDKQIICAAGIQTSSGSSVRTIWSEEANLDAGEYDATFLFNDVFLEANDYTFVVSLTIEGKTVQYIEDAIGISIEEVPGSTQSILPLRYSGAGLVLNQTKVDIKKIK